MMIMDETRLSDGSDHWIDRIGGRLMRLMYDLVMMRRRDHNYLVIMGRRLVWHYKKWPNTLRIQHCAKCELSIELQSRVGLS